MLSDEDDVEEDGGVASNHGAEGVDDEDADGMDDDGGDDAGMPSKRGGEGAGVVSELGAVEGVSRCRTGCAMLWPSRGNGAMIGSTSRMTL